jgi:hypothetical protein
LVTAEGHVTRSPHPSDRTYQWSGSGEQRRLCKRTLGFHRNPTRRPPLRPPPHRSSQMASLSEDLPRPAACHTAHRSPPRARRAAASASSPTSRPTREPHPHHSRSAALPMVKIKHAPGYKVPSLRFASSRVDAAARARQRSSFFPVLHVAIRHDDAFSCGRNRSCTSSVSVCDHRRDAGTVGCTHSMKSTAVGTDRRKGGPAVSVAPTATLCRDLEHKHQSPDTGVHGCRLPPAPASCTTRHGEDEGQPMTNSPPLPSPELNREGQPSAKEAPVSPRRSEEEARPLQWSTELVASWGRHRARRGRRPPSRHGASGSSNCAYELLDEMPCPWQASYCATALISPSFSANTDVSSAHLNSDLAFTMLTVN